MAGFPVGLESFLEFCTAMGCMGPARRHFGSLLGRDGTGWAEAG
jgi:hypothetical protein